MMNLTLDALPLAEDDRRELALLFHTINATGATGGRISAAALGVILAAVEERDRMREGIATQREEVARLRAEVARLRESIAALAWGPNNGRWRLPPRVVRVLRDLLKEPAATEGPR